MKQILKMMTVSLLLLAVIFSAGCAAEPKTFSQNGLTITLTEDFKEEDAYISYGAAFSSEDVSIVALQESFEEFDGDFGKDSTLEDYAKLLIESNRIDATVISENGLVYYTYDVYDIDTQDLYYRLFAFVYKTDDAFGLVQFAVNADAIKTQTENIFTYAKSVSFE